MCVLCAAEDGGVPAGGGVRGEARDREGEEGAGEEAADDDRDETHQGQR